MIEVLFSESEAGSMKIAKGCNRLFDGESIDGLAEEVVALPFMLQIGDIQKSVESTYRKNLIYEMYTIDGIEKPEILAELKKVGDKYIKEINRLKEFIYKGEPIRIWYSDAPYSMCGFYHLCNILNEHCTSCKISAIKLPKYLETDTNKLQQFLNWGEIMPEKFLLFLPLEKELTKNEIRLFSAKWNELVEDNSPIRAVINGQVLGVSEDFYDFIIRKEMPKEEIKVAQLIGHILGKYPLGVSDWWYGKRIQAMIEKGDFIIVENSHMRYGKLIKKRIE